MLFPGCSHTGTYADIQTHGYMCRHKRSHAHGRGCACCDYVYNPNLADRDVMMANTPPETRQMSLPGSRGDARDGRERMSYPQWRYERMMIERGGSEQGLK
eukprot:GHVU01174658.1.p1 GENE.GHVU01174658.1~~GHVU01174658.1.p1  ORF type:complete len:101 (-),score=4.54 GHVU01174658.1:76-378(-)